MSLVLSEFSNEIDTWGKERCNEVPSFLDAIAGGLASEETVTVSFLLLAFAQLFYVFNMREVTSGLLRNEVTENAYV
jgi:tellurite resistance protein TehA-like permease